MLNPSLLAQLLKPISGFFDRPSPLFDFSIAILKVDPSPELVSGEVTVVYQIFNYSTGVLHIRVTGQTDEGRSLHTDEFDLPAQSSPVRTTTTFWLSSGTHSFKIQARAQTNKTIVVPTGGPTPQLTTEYVYSDPSTDEASLQIYAVNAPPPAPSAIYLGPDEPNGATNGGSTAAGVISALAGGEGILYAVGKTAGVWSSVNGAPWKQLQGSPLYGNPIAIDPSSRNFVAVGGRSGDAMDPHLDSAGLWLSDDSGQTWNYNYDPFPDTGAQQVYDVAYSLHSSTLFLGTVIGVARRVATSTVMEFPVTARVGAIRALAVSPAKIWARTDSQLLFSTDDGASWTVISLPPTVDLPGNPGMTPIYDNTAGKGNGNDRASLAAFDDAAYLSLQVQDAAGNIPNKSPLLIYDANSNSFKAQWTNDNDGRGLGGRRFVRAYTLNCPALSPAIGQGRQFFYISGQGVQQALSENSDRTLNFDTVVLTDYALNPNPLRHIHADIWEFHIGPEYCPPAHITAWIGCDGGVYRAVVGPSGFGTSPNPNFNGTLSQMDWVTQSSGLHTHNVHNVVVVPKDSSQKLQVAYATQDNDGWWQKSDGQWRNLQRLGDASEVVGDGGNPDRAIVTRGFDDNQSVIVGFDDNTTPSLFAINPDAVEISCIQTLPTETDNFSKLDVVMLTKLPVHIGSVAEGPSYFSPGDFTDNFLLLRNQFFADKPDGPANVFNQWAVAATGLPGTPQGFWVSGGHQDPVFYLASMDANGESKLYKRVRNTGARSWQEGPWRWQSLMTGLLGPGTLFGAAFVDPYNSKHLFVVATNSTYPQGVIFRSTDGGQQFQPDEPLTALVTNSGRFPLGAYSPSNTFAEIGSTYHGATLFNPSEIAFYRNNSSWVAVCSPFTGAFYGVLSAGCFGPDTPTRERGWRSLSEYLPKPFAYISSVGIDGSALYLGTEGRGLITLMDPGKGLPASFIDPLRTGPGSLGVLRDTTSTPVPWARVFVNAVLVQTNSPGSIPMETRTRVANSLIRTDADGNIFLNPPLSYGRYIVDLRFPGDGALAPYETQFLHIVPRPFPPIP